MKEEKYDPKFCNDYFAPVSDLRTVDPADLDDISRKRLIYKGSKAIVEGQVCIVINAGGMGEDNQYFYQSKIWEKPVAGVDETIFEIITKRIKSVVEAAENCVTNYQNDQNLQGDKSQAPGKKINSQFGSDE